MKILIIGATGNSGLRLSKMALERGHDVSAYVRNVSKLETMLDGAASNVEIIAGELKDHDAMARAMHGRDAVINAAGNATVDENYVEMVQSIIDVAEDALGENGRFWFFGGAAALNVPGMNIRAADLPLIPKMFKQHIKNLDHVQNTSLDWSMLCPGPMNPASNGKAHEGLRVSSDIWPVEGPAPSGLFKTARILAAFKKRMPEMIISYEDAAQVILDNLETGGPFSRKRVGVALPPGVISTKSTNF